MDSEELFLLFVTAVNHHDVEALGALMAPEHVFIDSLGHRVAGMESMKAGWSGYFAMCPDYWIRVDNLIARDELILGVGEAGGTIDEVTWRTPAAWKSIVCADKVVEWCVFADNKPVYEIMAKR